MLRTKRNATGKWGSGLKARRNEYVDQGAFAAKENDPMEFAYGSIKAIVPT